MAWEPPVPLRASISWSAASRPIYGQVLAVAELAALRRGRELTRRALEAALQRHAEAAEKKGGAAATAPAAAAG